MSKLNYKIISDKKCLLGESPIWHESTNNFIWLDYLKSKILFYNPINKDMAEKKIDLETPLGGIALYNNFESLIISHKNGLSIINLDSLKMRDFSHPESTKQDVIYNDLKIDRHNNLWISTSHIDETEKKGSLWKLDKNKNLQLIDTGFKVSNGPAFSPCGNYIYFNDTFAYQTYRYKLSKENKHSLKKEFFYTFDKEDGYPDGITVDEEGSIWITHWGSGIITKQSPSGDIVKKFNLPSINLTSLCFGGKKFKDLVVTSATDGMEEKDWKNFPESGKTFLIKTKEKGIKENSYST